MDLSLVITSYRNSELLKLCIDSVKKYSQGLDCEVIVADSATQEDTEMMMREDYSDIKFFPHKENVGFQELIKKSIESSRGSYILFLNGDIIVAENSIQKLLDFIKKNNNVGMVGPKLLNFNGTLQQSCFRFYRPLTILYRRMPNFFKKIKFIRRHLDWFLMQDFDHKKARNVDWLMGSALMARREAIEKVGIMDTRFFMYMEDVDWCRRFWENGFSVVYYPDSQMNHYHGRGSKKGGLFYSLFFNKLTWVHITSGIKYFIKYWRKEIPKYNEATNYE